MGMGCFEAEMQLRNTLRRSKMLQLSWMLSEPGRLATRSMGLMSYQAVLQLRNTLM